jgi:hypothetical protein
VGLPTAGQSPSDSALAGDDGDDAVGDGTERVIEVLCCEHPPPSPCPRLSAKQDQLREFIFVTRWRDTREPVILTRLQFA